MKVSLDISDDQELRNHIKEAIRGQVKSIAREEVAMLVKDEMARKIHSLQMGHGTSLNQMIADAVNTDVRRTLAPHYITEDSLVSRLVAKGVESFLAGQNFEKLVTIAANAKIAALAKNASAT